ncbi:MAG: hypothetical protein AB2A00_41990 [Myxococcota bacterium]
MIFDVDELTRADAVALDAVRQRSLHGLFYDNDYVGPLSDAPGANPFAGTGTFATEVADLAQRHSASRYAPLLRLSSTLIYALSLPETTGLSRTRDLEALRKERVEEAVARLVALAEDGSTPLAARASYEVARLKYRLGDVAGTRTWLERTQRMAGPGADPALAYLARHWLATNGVFSNKPPATK